jgi:hypothetical protein
MTLQRRRSRARTCPSFGGAAAAATARRSARWGTTWHVRIWSLHNSEQRRPDREEREAEEAALLPMPMRRELPRPALVDRYILVVSVTRSWRDTRHLYRRELLRPTLVDRYISAW